ncbi:MAG TPA: glutathione transferase GstA [Myxococcales bacterium]|nr:glutathione transferase GstA [Myxococcales bacterium]
MRLFYVPGACSLSPHIAVRELGLPVQLERVDRQTKKSTPSGLDYKALNPKGYVPGLQLDDGQMLTEGVAIVQYLADQAPEKRLAPAAGTLERYRLQEWLNFIATELHKGVSPLFNPKLPDDLRKTFKDRVLDRLGLVEKTLEKQPFLMGQQFTVADCYLYVILSWSPRVGLDLTAFPSIKAYFDRLTERPSVKAALQEERAAA